MINFSFNNLGHSLASFFKTAYADVKKVGMAAENEIPKIEAAKPIVERVTAAAADTFAPGSQAVVVTIEDAAFAVLGAVDAALKSGGDAAQQHLLDAGLDQTAIDAVKAVGNNSKTFYQLVTNHGVEPSAGV